MLIIDLIKQHVNQAAIDPDVVIIKGATPELIESLTRLTLTSGVDVVNPNPRKVSLGYNNPLDHGKPDREKISKVVPQSVYAEGDDNFDATYARLAEILHLPTNKEKKHTTKYPLSTTRKVERTLGKSTESRTKIQREIIDAFIVNDLFISTLQQAVKNNTTLNRRAKSPTTNNIMAAVALYVYYGGANSFSSTGGSEKIVKSVIAGPDTIARLATDFTILYRTGFSTATRYFISKVFIDLILSTLDSGKFDDLVQEVDALQAKLDNLI
jgi:hypothetical protein